MCVWWAATQYCGLDCEFHWWNGVVLNMVPLCVMKWFITMTICVCVFAVGAAEGISCSSLPSKQCKVNLEKMLFARKWALHVILLINVLCNLFLYLSNVGNWSYITLRVLFTIWLEQFSTHSYCILQCNQPLSWLTQLRWDIMILLYRFYTYGDMPLLPHLEQIDRDILQHFSKCRQTSVVPLEKRWQQPVSS